MRTGDRVKYDKRIPPLTVYLSTAKRCRFWNLSCGPVFSEVASIQPGGDILQTLPFTQPARFAAPDGITVNVRPSGRPNQPFGFDMQVRQTGRLLARFRRAGRCRDEHRSTGIFHGATGSGKILATVPVRLDYSSSVFATYEGVIRPVDGATHGRRTSSSTTRSAAASGRKRLSTICQAKPVAPVRVSLRTRYASAKPSPGVRR